MKSCLLILGITLFAATYGCQSAEQSSPATEAGEPAADSILRDTVTNSQGVQLVMAYNNARHTATFVLAGEVIRLNQDTLASGISYRNAQYEYTEHQGMMTLKKGGKIVFSNK